RRVEFEATRHGQDAVTVLQRALLMFDREMPKWLSCALHECICRTYIKEADGRKGRAGGIDEHRADTGIRLRRQGAKWTDDEIYEQAAKELQGTWAAGGPDAIKASYRRHKRRFRDIAAFIKDNELG